MIGVVLRTALVTVQYEAIAGFFGDSLLAEPVACARCIDSGTRWQTLDDACRERGIIFSAPAESDYILMC